MQRVALLGLGAMGAGMAASWLNKGFPLTVWNCTPARADAIAAMGARAAETPRAAAEGADVIVAVVADDAASRAVWLGASGALAGAKSGAICVELSTLSPEWVRELAELRQGARLPLSRRPNWSEPPGGGGWSACVLRRRRGGRGRRS